MNKIIIAPSLLSSDFSNLSNEIKKFKDIENIWFHLDIMDGHFVPNLTFGATVLKNLHKITKHPLDAHFMVTHPLNYIEAFSALGIHNFTFHYETSSNPLAEIQQLKKHFPSVGISIKPKTSLDVLSNDILKAVDLVLIMSVEPGFGGQSYIKGSEVKVQTLKEKREQLGANYLIQVDGGVNEKTAPILKESGADILVAGSFIFNSHSYLEAVESLKG